MEPFRAEEVREEARSRRVCRSKKGSRSRGSASSEDSGRARCRRGLPASCREKLGSRNGLQRPTSSRLLGARSQARPRSSAQKSGPARLPRWKSAIGAAPETPERARVRRRSARGTRRSLLRAGADVPGARFSSAGKACSAREQGACPPSYRRTSIPSNQQGHDLLALFEAANEVRPANRGRSAARHRTLQLVVRNCWLRAQPARPARIDLRQFGGLTNIPNGQTHVDERGPVLGYRRVRVGIVPLRERGKSTEGRPGARL